MLVSSKLVCKLNEFGLGLAARLYFHLLFCLLRHFIFVQAEHLLLLSACGVSRQHWSLMCGRLVCCFGKSCHSAPLPTLTVCCLLFLIAPVNLTHAVVVVVVVDPQQLPDLIVSGHRLPCPPGCPAPIYDIMMRCWSIKPSTRPSFQTIVDLLGAIVVDEDALEAIGLPFL